ncbi:MAG: iron-containing alcohol dehydrogenase [Candidatus Nanopelagicales bacterium]
MSAVDPQRLPVGSWSCPTTLIAAEGASLGIAKVAALAQIGGSGPPPILVVVDEALLALPAVGALLAGVDDAPVLPVSAEGVDRGFLDGVVAGMQAAAVASGQAPLLVAIGGGSVMDAAKLAAHAASEPEVLDILDASSGGLLFRPGAPTDSAPVVCLPTTLGTASEVSPVALFTSFGRGSTMVVGPGLRPRVAIVDPALTATLTVGALAAGLLEPLARALVPAVCGERLPLQDAQAGAIVETLLVLGDRLAAGEAADPGWRRAAALSSIATHTSFLALGRSPMGHALWPLATELMAEALTTKPVALARLLPRWLAGLESGRLGGPFGAAQRVEEVLGMSAGGAAVRLASWVAALPLDNGRTAVEPAPDAVAARVISRWQEPGWFLPGADVDHVRWLLAASG